MHVGKGRKNPLHVDYVFLGACLGYIQDAMTEAILSHPRLDLTQKIAIVKAIGKVIWIQNDLMAKWHVDDGKEFIDAEWDEETQAEARQPEGYVNGKRVLGKVDEDDSSIDGTASSVSSEKSTTSLGRTMEQVRLSNEQIGCPFSGMVNGTQDLDKQRAATTKPPRDDILGSPSSPSGIPRLRVMEGKTIGKERLGPSPFA